MRVFRITSLQWAIGAFSVLLGAMMLVAPHQFDSSEYATVRGNLLFWGVVFFVLGAATFAASALRLSNPLHWGIHIAGVASLLMLATGFAATGFWNWVVNYAVMAIGLLFAGLTPEQQRDHSSLLDDRSAIRLLPLFIGIDALLDGLLLLFFPYTFVAERYTSMRSLFPWLGVVYSLAGVGLIALQLFPQRMRWLRILVYLFAGAAYLWYTILVPIPNRILSGLIFYGGISLILLSLPLLERPFTRLDPTQLRIRLALLLAATMSIPLVITVTLISNQEERSVRQEVLQRQQAEATVLAEGVSRYVTLHHNALDALSHLPEIVNLSPSGARERLQEFANSYPDVTAFALFNAQGDQIARSDNQPMLPARGYPVFEEARSDHKPSSDVLISPVYKYPIFAFGYPVMDKQVHFLGVVTMALASTHLSTFLSNQSSDPSILVYLVDENGRVIAHPSAKLVQEFADYSHTAPVEKLFGSGKHSSNLVYGPAGSEKLAGMAMVPGLGWGVVVERTAGTALASVHRGRDLAFAIMLIFLAIAIVAGVILAGWIAQPLDALRQAAVQLSSGDGRSPLPSTAITEIQTLSDVFGVMRDRLAARTAEREQAQTALREANEELEAKVVARTIDLEQANASLELYAQQLMNSNRELQDFAYIASHDLQEPLRKIRAFGDRLKSRASGQLDTDSLDYIERMQSASVRMQSMIDSLLAYSRVTTKAQPLTTVDLNQVAAEVINDLEVRIEQSGGKVELNDLPNVKADPLQMRQLLQNLIANGLKFHRPGETPLVQVSGQVLPNGYAEICVKDNGIGFDEKYLERIFQPFNRLQGRSEYEGSGIGLAICRKIVERHHGTITAASQPGQGATFIITLPLGEKA